MMISYEITIVLLAFSMCLRCEKLVNQLSEDDIFSLVDHAFNTTATDTEYMDTGETIDLASGIDKRRQLPKGDLFKKGMRHDKLKCGTSYPIQDYGYLCFKLYPDKQPCHYNFLGSKNQGCKVSILCRGRMKFAPPTDGKCEEEFFVISDGTDGIINSCGNFTFAGKPRLSKNNGADLYMFLKGRSRHSCIVFCYEDLGKEKRPGIKEVKMLAVNKKYKRLPVESGCMCGKRRNFGRVVGGETAFKFEFPWIGSVVFKNGPANRKPFCGGTLINDNYFVSAAHCFAISEIMAWEIQVILHAHVMDKRIKKGMDPDDPIFQKIPGWELETETDESEGTLRMDVEEIWNHPLFDKNTFDYDIAVVKFTKKIDLSEGKIAPICLPRMNETFRFDDGATMVVAGWGRPWEGAPAGARALQKLDVPFMNRQKCMTYTVPTNRHICAGFTEGGKDACTGDSGGPLVYMFNRDDNQYLLSGVVSAGAGCARTSKLGLYTDVQELIQWVYQHASKAKWCTREIKD